MPRETLFGFSGVYFIFSGIIMTGDGGKLIFSLTKKFLIGNRPVYQNLQRHVKTVAM
jgi:hypothetical protein